MTQRKEEERLSGAVETFLALPVRSEKRKEELAGLGVPRRGMSNRMSLAAALVGAAVSGDVRAAKLVVDLLDDGEAVKEDSGVKIVEDL